MKFMEFKRGGAIMGGDFNFCVVPGYDSTSWAQRTENVQWKVLKKNLYQNQLIGVWRIQ